MVHADTLWREPKWTRFPEKESRSAGRVPTLGDFFAIKRGLATGKNSYFILTAEEIAARGLPLDAFQPILPSPRYVPEDAVRADECGNPILERRLFLLHCRLPEDEIRQRYPRLWEYLQEGVEAGVADSYLCRHRSPWYSQEDRPAAPFVCTYLGRSDGNGRRPFRFLLNESRATAANVYLMLYPKGPLARLLEGDAGLKERVWRILNEICPTAMLGEGRVYGGGLYKLEPKELANVPAGEIAALAYQGGVVLKQAIQANLFDLSDPKLT